MAINIADLPPKYQAQAMQKFAQQSSPRKLPEPLDTAKAKPGKYHNTHTIRATPAGVILHFDSKKEARRYDYLAALEAQDKIRDLRLQADFTLQEAYTDSLGRRVRAIRYRADFTYLKPKGADGAYWVDTGAPWVRVVEDVKSRPTKTRAYLMKKKLLKERFGIDINEV